MPNVLYNIFYTDALNLNFLSCIFLSLKYNLTFIFMLFLQSIKYEQFINIKDKKNNRICTQVLLVSTRKHRCSLFCALQNFVTNMVRVCSIITTLYKYRNYLFVSFAYDLQKQYK